MVNADVLNDILDIEGGFVDHENDRGGVTKYGITLDTLARWRRAPVTSADLRELTRDEAREILFNEYVVMPGIDRLPGDLLPWFMADFAVHSGPATAIKMLQREVGAADDGVIGPKTLEAVQQYMARFGEVGLVVSLVRARLGFLARIVARDPDQAVFFRGWVNRVTRFLDATISAA